MVFLGPIGAAGLGRDLWIRKVDVQGPNGVVVQGEQLGMGLVVRRDVFLRDLGVEAAFDVPVLVRVDEEASAIGLEGLFQAWQLLLQLRSRLGHHDLLPHPPVDDPLGEGRTVFQVEVVRHPRRQAVPSQNLAVRFGHDVFAKARFQRHVNVSASHPGCRQRHAPQGVPHRPHWRTKLYRASRLILCGYLRCSSMIHSCSRWSW